MDIREALRGIVGLPTWVVMRPRGLMLGMSERQVVLHFGRNGPHKWTPAFPDLVALDWQPFSPEQIAQMRAAAEAANGVG